MDMDDALPGHLVASVFEVLLVDAGYQVVPTGVERTIRELRAVKVDAYIDLVTRGCGRPLISSCSTWRPARVGSPRSSSVSTSTARCATTCGLSSESGHHSR